MSKKGWKLLPQAGNSEFCLSDSARSARLLLRELKRFAKEMPNRSVRLTQMGTIRLGKRTENRVPKIKDFVPLAALEDVVFGAWDIFPDSAYEAALHAGVLEKSLVEDLREQLDSLKPMAAVFSQNYVKRLNGTNIKEGKNKMELAEQLMADIAQVSKKKKAVKDWSSFGRLRRKFFSKHRKLINQSKRLKKRCMTTTRRSRLR